MKNEPIIRKYIDPMVDYGFKKIFKESGKKQLIIRPLNEIFGLDIADIEFRESEQLGLLPEAHRVTYDLFCTGADGNRFIIEVQLGEQKHFLERALFYTALPIAKSAPKQPAAKSGKGKKKSRKKRFRWSYNYPPVFFMGLLNFDLRHFNPNLKDQEEFIHMFSLRDERTGELMTDRLRFAFLEVARFDKPQEECRNFQDRFLYLMRNLPTFVQTPELWSDDEPYFQEFLREAEFANMTDRQQERYLAQMMQEWDYQNTLDFAREKGLNEGRAEGRAEGEAKGRAEGEAKGRAEGEAKGRAEGEAKGRAEGEAKGRAEGERKKAIEIARSLNAMKIPVETIVRATGLSEEEVRAMQ